MSNKIQILTDKQVNHLASVIINEMKIKFYNKVEELTKLVESKKNEFLENENIKKKLKIQEEEKSKVLMYVNVMKYVLETEPNLVVKAVSSYDPCFDKAKKVIENPDYLKKMEKDNDKDIDDMLINLTQESLHINDMWMRENKMCDDIRARLCVMVVKPYEEIIKTVSDSIDVNSYFNN